MPEPLPPYLFDWRVHSIRLVFGNFIALIAVGVLWALGMLPLWLTLFPVGIHLFFCFDAWREQQRKRNREINYD